MMRTNGSLVPVAAFLIFIIDTPIYRNATFERVYILSMRTSIIQAEVLRVIKESKGKATTSVIMTALCLDRKRTSNALFRLKKIDAIATVFPGVYKAV